MEDENEREKRKIPMCRWFFKNPEKNEEVYVSKCQYWVFIFVNNRGNILPSPLYALSLLKLILFTFMVISL